MQATSMFQRDGVELGGDFHSDFLARAIRRHVVGLLMSASKNLFAQIVQMLTPLM